MARIPRLFHFVFGVKPQDEPFHLAFFLCIESCRRVNRPDEIFFYYHHEPFGPYWELTRRLVTPIRVRLNPFIEGYQYADRRIGRYRYAHHSDFIRLEKLLEGGGVYADIDTIFVNPFPAHLWEQKFVLGREDDIVTPTSAEPQKSLCNALIMAEPQAEFGQRWLAEMQRSFDGSWSEHSTLLPERLSHEWPGIIHVEPRRSFYEYACTPQGLHTLLEGLNTDYSGILSMHLWSHLWWSKKRRDFSRFHAGLLTESYVSRVDTTYNLVARRYLPRAIRSSTAHRMDARESSDAARGTHDSISVIIPTRGRSHFAEAAVQSVLLQTHPVRQIVLVDDGSSPEQALHLQALACRHREIELHRVAESRGAAAARNLGLERACGDYILFLDDDDLVHPRLCGEGLAVLRRRPDADAVVFLYDCIFTPAQLGDTYPVALLFDYRRLSSHPLNRIAGGNPVPQWSLEKSPVSSFLRFLIPINSCLVRRAAIGDCRFPEWLRQGEDTYFWVCLAARGCRFTSDSRVYAFVRRHPANTTGSRSRYVDEIQDCYEALIAKGVIGDPRDIFLVHLKLLWFKVLSGRPGWASHLGRVLLAPGLLARELTFWAANLRARKRLFDYYFAK